MLDSYEVIAVLDFEICCNEIRRSRLMQIVLMHTLPTLQSSLGSFSFQVLLQYSLVAIALQRSKYTFNSIGNTFLK